MRSSASQACLWLGLLLALSGCFGPGGGSVFGPVAGGEEGAASAPAWAIALKAKPARGPVPLEVAFDLRVAGAPEDLPWRAEFGDRSRPESGVGETAAFRHTFEDVGDHEVIVVVGSGADLSRSTLTIVARPAGTEVEDGDEEVEGTQLPDEDDDGDEDGDDGEEGEEDDGDFFGTRSSSGSAGPSSSSTGTSPASPSSTGGSSAGGSTTGDSTGGPAPSGTSSPPTTTSRTTSSSPAPAPSPSPSPAPSPSPTPSPSPSPTPRPSPSPAPSPSSSPSPGNQMPEATLDASPYGGRAPVEVTYTVTVRDPDGDALSWTLAVDGRQVLSGTQADSPARFRETYTEEGSHTAVLTVTDGQSTARRQLTLQVYEGPI